MECTSRSSPMPHQASKNGGRYGHARRGPRGHRCPVGSVSSARQPTTCGDGAAHIRNAFSCTSTFETHVRLRIGIGHVENRLRITASRSKIGKLRRRPDPTAPPRTRRVSSPPLTTALLAMSHGLPAGRSAIRCCRTAAPGHRNRPRSLAVRSCGSSSSRSPSAAPPRAGRCARTSCTRGRVLGWRPTPNYCPPPRPRSFRRFSRRLPIDHTAPLTSRCAARCLSRHPCPSCFRNAVATLPCPRVNPPFAQCLGGLGKSTTFPHRPGTPARRTPPSSRRIGSFQVRRRKDPGQSIVRRVFLPQQAQPATPPRLPSGCAPPS